MTLELKGLYTGLKFSSAHVVFGHDSCGVIHGHTYYVDVKLYGEPSGDFGFILDFKILKKIVKKICKTLDHKLLIPENHSNLKYSITNNHIIYTFCNKDSKKEYKIPLEDILLLPLKGTTAEELSIYIAELVKKELSNLNIDYNINCIEITLYEGLGQGATYRISLDNENK
ncbi:6-carboxytetrahydropterin synthase [Methanothermococcus sp. SCGC AD-155-C09]|nr:6-carboxytetrahydropterin synthase [Methanothermococcus sp. SCGC AD-155-C09]